MTEMNPLYVPLQSKTGPSVCSILGLSSATVKRIIKRDPSFPQPLVVASNCYRFKVAEVIAWADSAARRKAN